MTDKYIEKLIDSRYAKPRFASFYDGVDVFRNGNVKYKAKEPKFKKKEFILTPYLSVKLEKKQSIIYVNGEKFNQCKYLLLTIDSQLDWEKQEEINSIDDAAKFLNRDHEHNKTTIPPETEFWGHCSNLQAWVENRYDLRVIHTNLGFPLLKKLAEHDPIALMSLKEEIASRIETNGYKAFQINRTVIDKFFTENEKFILIDKIKQQILSIIEEKKYDYSQYLRFKTFIGDFFTKEEKFILLQEIKYNLILKIKEAYNEVDIYSFLKKNCVLCNEVFSTSGLRCTLCIKFSNFTPRKGIIIPKERYENFNIDHFSLDRLLILYKTLKPWVIPSDSECTTFPGGRGDDNDVAYQDDFIWTIINAIVKFRETFKNFELPIRILTHPNLRIVASIDNHFNTLRGLSEFEQIMNLGDVSRWEVSLEINENVMYFYDQSGNGLSTGVLTIE